MMDGVEKAFTYKKQETPSNFNNFQEFVAIGARNNNGVERFVNGQIDDFRIYNKALTEEEIGNLYNGQDITNGLVGHWKFDEGTGAIAGDSSGNNNDGTISGANWTEGLTVKQDDWKYYVITSEGEYIDGVVGNVNFAEIDGTELIIGNKVISDFFFLPYVASSDEVEFWYEEYYGLGGLTPGDKRSGYRESSEINVSQYIDIIRSSNFKWEENISEGEGIFSKMEFRVSFNNGIEWTEWEEIETNSSIPGLSTGKDVSEDVLLQLRQFLESDDLQEVPLIEKLTLLISSY